MSKQGQGTTFKFTIRCASVGPDVHASMFCLSPAIVSFIFHFISFHFFLLFITDILIGEVEKVEIPIQQNMGNTGRRILVVEGERIFLLFFQHHCYYPLLTYDITDNTVNQKVLMRQLTMAGYLCDVANDGREGVEKYELGNYDLVFMDVVCSSQLRLLLLTSFFLPHTSLLSYSFLQEMPVMNGFEATKEIRRREKEMGIAKGVVIIGLSGNARDVYSEMGQSAGMDDYVVSEKR